MGQEQSSSSLRSCDSRSPTKNNSPNNITNNITSRSTQGSVGGIDSPLPERVQEDANDSSGSSLLLSDINCSVNVDNCTAHGLAILEEDKIRQVNNINAAADAEEDSQNNLAHILSAKVPESTPLLPQVLQSSRHVKYGLELKSQGIGNIDTDSAVNVCNILQTVLKEEATRASHNQKVIHEAIKDIDDKIKDVNSSAMKLDTLSLQMNEVSKEVKNIGKILGNTQEKIYKLSETLIKVNLHLPQEERLPDFKWHLKT